MYFLRIWYSVYFLVNHIHPLSQIFLHPFLSPYLSKVEIYLFLLFPWNQNFIAQFVLGVENALECGWSTSSNISKKNLYQMPMDTQRLVGLHAYLL